MKVEICFDSNGRVVDSDYAFSSRIFDTDDLDNDEVSLLCECVNDENLNNLGYCKTKEEICESFLNLTIDDFGEESDIKDIEWKGAGIYVCSAFFVLGEAYISTAKDTIEREIEDMQEEYKEVFNILRSD